MTPSGVNLSSDFPVSALSDSEEHNAHHSHSNQENVGQAVQHHAGIDIGILGVGDLGLGYSLSGNGAGLVFIGYGIAGFRVAAAVSGLLPLGSAASCLACSTTV